MTLGQRKTIPALFPHLKDKTGGPTYIKVTF